MPRILIVDDSAVVRQVLSAELARHPGIHVIGSAPDPVVARDIIVRERPDVITLDLEMPRMDGLEFLRRIMAHLPLPVIVVSSLTPAGSALALEAMAAGAVDVLCKPGSAYSVGALAKDIAERAVAVAGRAMPKPRAAQTARADTSARASAPLGLRTTTDQVIAIGASTGGTTAVETLLTGMPASAPGMAVVIHMPPGFTKSFAERLSRITGLDVKEAAEGDRLVPGRVVIAPGDRHLVLRRQGATYVAGLMDGPRIGLHKPAVNVLFKSVATVVGANAVGVILTGMGRDGAEGLKAMRDAGARTIAQDEASCVVFGMPKEAIDLGAAQQVLPLEAIAGGILGQVERHHHRVHSDAPELANLPVLDPTAAARLRAFPADLGRSMWAGFVQDLPHKRREVDEAMARRDEMKAKTLIDDLRRSADSVGLARLAQALGQSDANRQWSSLQGMLDDACSAAREASR
jgi:two-component system chemotaxis response regulator CheB